jgi:hypothetical protein
MARAGVLCTDSFSREEDRWKKNTAAKLWLCFQFRATPFVSSIAFGVFVRFTLNNNLIFSVKEKNELHI